MTLDFSSDEDQAVPGFGYEILTGTYAEQLSGLHRNDIFVSGSFRLTRVNDVAQLNDGQ
mgnify:FL=1